MLDCGLKIQDITKSKDFDSFKNLDFVFCSHIHKDHSLSLEDFKLTGTECLWWENLTPNKKVEIGQWTVVPFPAMHNAINFGIIIHDNFENKTMVYATDFVKIPPIENVDYWLYEINYDNFTVDKIIENEDLENLHIANNVKYHNSLENAVAYFEALKTRPKLVIACHLSNMGGCADNIMYSMKPLCDRIEIAKKNKTFEF